MSGGDWKDMVRAIQNGKIEIVKYHIANGIDPNYEHPELYTTPLIESILRDDLEITAYLLENGADPKLKSGFNLEEPLGIAKRLKNKEMMKLLKSYIPKKYIWSWL